MLIEGHAFFVHRASIETNGRVVCVTEDGRAAGVAEVATEIDIKLVHADWTCCPAVQAEKSDRPDVHLHHTLPGDELRALHHTTHTVVFEPLTEEESGRLDAAVQKTIRDTLPHATRRAEQRIADELGDDPRAARPAGGRRQR